MIDIWLLFGLVLPFVGFLLSIFEELVVQQQEDLEEQGEAFQGSKSAGRVNQVKTSNSSSSSSTSSR